MYRNRSVRPFAHAVSGPLAVAALALSFLALAGAPPASAETFTVDAIRSEFGSIDLGLGETSFCWYFGENIARDGTEVLAAGFDLSFLPPGTVVNGATLSIILTNGNGNPTSLGALEAAVLRPFSISAPGAPYVEPRWATAEAWPAVTLADPVPAGGGTFSGDITDAVRQWLGTDHEGDPGRLIVRFWLDGAPNGDDALDRWRTHFPPRLRLDVTLPDPIASRPVDRHEIHVLPVAASNDGLAGTRWVTELSLRSTVLDHPIAVWLYYTPSGVSGMDTFQVRRIDLAPETTRTFDDLLPELFGVGGQKGWVELFFSSPGVEAVGRIANVGGEGTYGQTVGLQGWETAASTLGCGYRTSVYRTIPGVRLDAASRNNLGFVNVTPIPATVRVEIRRPDGSTSVSLDVPVPPMGHVQLRRLTDLAPELAGYGATAVSFHPDWPDSGDVTVFGYLSRVDETTGDAVFVPGR